MTDIAVELAHRAEPDHLKELARDKAEELKDLAKDKAQEQFVVLKERAKDKAQEQFVEMKDLAREKAMQKTYELRDQFAASRSRPYVGAALGASVGWLLFRKLFGSRSQAKLRRLSANPYTERSYDADPGYVAEGAYSEDFYGVDQPARTGVAVEGQDFYVSPDIAGSQYSGDAELGVKERAGEAVSNAAGKASDAVHSAAGKASHAVHSVADKASGAVHSAAEKASGVMHSAKDKASQLASSVPSPSEVQQRSSEWYQRSVQEQPLIFALGAVVLGMVASALLPVSGRERRLVHPAKQKVIEPAIQRAQAALESLGHKAEEALGGPSSDIAQNKQQGPGGIILNASTTGTVSASAAVGSARSTASNAGDAQKLTEDPMSKDEFGLGIPDPQTFPTRR